MKAKKNPSTKNTKNNLVNTSNKKPVGRPKHSGEKWNPIYIEIVKELASEGYIETEIQKIIHISIATFNKWKKDHPEFHKSLKEGKENPDRKVEKALFENAIGGEYETEKALVVSDGGKNGAHVEVVKVKENRAGNVTAQIYWTKNRMPEKWRDKQDVEHSGSLNYKIIPDDELEDKEE